MRLLSTGRLNAWELIVYIYIKLDFLKIEHSVINMQVIINLLINKDLCLIFELILAELP